MSWIGRARRCAVGFLLCLSLSGCFPVGDSQSDEKKEPNFLTGKNLVIQMDYQGAVESFEKSVEVNPHSASAHFELGWLYEGKVTPPDPAAAIYHYDRFLRYSTNPDKAEADLARQHINNCKLELAKTVSALGPLPSPVQREMERVLFENKNLEARLAALQTQLDDFRAGAAAHAQPAPVTAVAPEVAPTTAPARATVDLKHDAPIYSSVDHSNFAAITHHTGNSGGLKAHSIRSGETMAAIARRYGVSISSLLAANPQARPTHLLVGQILNIPAP